MSKEANSKYCGTNRNVDWLTSCHKLKISFFILFSFVLNSLLYTIIVFIFYLFYDTKKRISRWLFLLKFSFRLFSSKVNLDFFACFWCWALRRYIQFYWREKTSLQHRGNGSSCYWKLLCSSVLVQRTVVYGSMVVEPLGSLWHTYIPTCHEISKMKHQKTVTELLNWRWPFQNSHQSAKLFVWKGKRLLLHVNGNLVTYGI